MRVSTPWFSARDSAEAMLFRGATGHLATVTSQEENDFILDAFGASTVDSFWLGGNRTSVVSDPAIGWEWITGEEWLYTNWAVGEPNNAHVNETALQFHFRESTGKWNDLRPISDG